MQSGILRRACVGSFCTVVPHPRNAYRPYLLRHPVLAFVSAFLVVSKIGVVALVALLPDVAYLSTIAPAFLIDQTNAARQEAGLPPLKEHPLLSRAARLKAEDMLAHDYFEHTSPTGVTPWKWFDDAKYRYVYAGENLAIDFATGEAVHKAWMQSPGHSKNIMSDRYRDIGIAVVTGEFQGRTTTVVAQHFGSLSPVTSPTLPPPSPAAAPSAKPSSPSPSPSPSTSSVPAPSESPLPPPTILEPTEGQLLESGASTVRGTSVKGSTVNVTTDGLPAGSFAAKDGTFAGTITPPPEEERELVLAAWAERNGKQGPPSPPRRVRVDTRGPSIAKNGALFLPDPRGSAGNLLLVVTLEGAPTRAVARLGERALPLRIFGEVASASVGTRDAASPIQIEAADANGNTRTASVQPLRQFHVTPSTTGESDARVRVTLVSDDMRTLLTFILTLLAALLAINILVHVRIQHADLIAHALFVVALGTTLLFLT